MDAQGSPAFCLFVKCSDSSGVVTPSTVLALILYDWKAFRNFTLLDSQASYFFQENYSCHMIAWLHVHSNTINTNTYTTNPKQKPGSRALSLEREVMMSTIIGGDLHEKKLSQILHLNHVNLLGISLQ